jgi:hypothetical protein
MPYVIQGVGYVRQGHAYVIQGDVPATRPAVPGSERVVGGFVPLPVYAPRTSVGTFAPVAATSVRVFWPDYL